MNQLSEIENNYCVAHLVNGTRHSVASMEIAYRLALESCDPYDVMRLCHHAFYDKESFVHATASVIGCLCLVSVGSDRMVAKKCSRVQKGNGCPAGPWEVGRPAKSLILRSTFLILIRLHPSFRQSLHWVACLHHLALDLALALCSSL